MVCEQDWEPRQPQDFVRGIADQQAPVWTRPEPVDTFIAVFNPVYNNSAAGTMIAGQAESGTPLPSWYQGVPPSTFTEP
jgi:hypothetical protein